MKKLIVTTTFILTFSSAAQAYCVGSSAFMTCSDGTTYNTIGNTMYGSNSRTGTNWSQTTIGNYTFGQASNGKRWQSFNNGNNSWGTDSNGNSWSCFGDFCN